MNTTSDTNSASAIASKSTKLFVIVFASVFMCTQVWGVVAVYRDVSVMPYTTWGEGAAATTLKARDKALADCIANGGTDCQMVTAGSNGVGWEATAYDSVMNITVTTFGKKSKKQAKHLAKKGCKDAGGQNCKVVSVIYDRFGNP